MCFGGKSKSAAPATTPPPTPPTTFNYVGPDDSNTRQRLAATESATGQPTAMSSFGSELGAGGTIPTATPGVA